LFEGVVLVLDLNIVLLQWNMGLGLQMKLHLKLS
jgi:hypothetical protein